MSHQHSNKILLSDTESSSQISFCSTISNHFGSYPSTTSNKSKRIQNGLQLELPKVCVTLHGLFRNFKANKGRICELLLGFCYLELRPCNFCLMYPLDTVSLSLISVIKMYRSIKICILFSRISYGLGGSKKVMSKVQPLLPDMQFMFIGIVKTTQTLSFGFPSDELFPNNCQHEMLMQLTFIGHEGLIMISIMFV